MIVSHKNLFAQKGFTLIEMMMVVLLIAILTAAAIPQYNKMVEKTKISEAESIMATVRKAQEVYRMEQGTYSSTLEDLPLTTEEYQSSYFSFEIQDATEDNYKISAERLAGEYVGSVVWTDNTGAIRSEGKYTKLL